MTELTGTVARVFSNRGAWCAGVLTLAESTAMAGITPHVKFAGACSVAEGDEVTLHGEWKNDPKWGRQFSVRLASYGEATGIDREAQDKRALISFLKSNKDLKHIGEKRAEMLIDAFGGIEGLGNALICMPDQVVSTIPGLTAERVAFISAQWAVACLTIRYQLELVKFGLNPDQARAVVASFGSGTLEVLKENPWLLYLKVRHLSWDKVDSAALSMGFPMNHHYRLHAMAVRDCRDAGREGGHVWIPGEVGSLHMLMKTEQALPGHYLEIIDWGDGGYVLAPYELARAEELIEAYLCDTAYRQPRICISETPVDKLTDEQMQAFLAARKHQVLILTGGAGTGKTYTADAIVEAYENAGGRVVLCAPTGKAAKRLTESTGRPAYTIHLLLLSPELHGALEEADLVLVDEVSMVDSELLGWLLKELPARASLILMGDPNQLPPVQPGNPLRDALTLDTPIVELSHVHRSAGDLKDCCVQVLDGKVADNVPGVWEVRKAAGGLSLHAKLQNAITMLEQRGHAFPEDIQVLSPMKKGVNGTLALNKMLRERHHGPDVGDVFVEGDRVIQTRNDYTLEVFNGQVGRVLQAYPDDPKKLIVDMDGKALTYKPYVDTKGSQVYPVNNLEWAYALTVHKTQGSEYPVIVLTLDNYHSRMLHRNLLYTAVTRAREQVVILTTNAAIATAANHVVRDQRRTLLM